MLFLWTHVIHLLRLAYHPTKHRAYKSYRNLNFVLGSNLNEHIVEVGNGRLAYICYK